MLAVFERIDADERWYKRLIHKLIMPAPSGVLELIETTPYIKITCQECQKGFAWRRISEISLDCSGRMLMPVDIFPPPDCGVVRFVPQEFPAKMLERLAYSILKNAQISPHEISLALYGDFLTIERVLPMFIDFANDIRVISNDADKLSDFVEGTVDMTGASIMLTNDIGCADSCNIVIASNGIDPNYKGSKDAWLFAPKRSLSFSSQVMSAEVEIPQWLNPAYRTFYDRMEFLSAFYEIAKVRSLEDLEPVGGVGKYGTISSDAIISKLKNKPREAVAEA